MHKLADNSLQGGQERMLKQISISIQLPGNNITGTLHVQSMHSYIIDAII